MANPFIRRLSQLVPLRDGELACLAGLCEQIRDVPAKRYLARNGDRLTSFPVILSGWAVVFQILRDGGRQITRILLPGDAVGYDSPPPGSALEEAVTLSGCKVANIRHADMAEAVERFPAIGEALRAYGRQDNAVLSSWVINVGRRDALERLTHLMCETRYRLAMIEPRPGNTIHFPLTQDDLADALGLTPVHVNRKLQQLRMDGLISLRSRQLTFHDLHALEQLAGFDGAYLDQRPMAGGRLNRWGSIAA